MWADDDDKTVFCAAGGDERKPKGCAGADDEATTVTAAVGGDERKPEGCLGTDDEATTVTSAVGGDERKPEGCLGADDDATAEGCAGGGDERRPKGSTGAADAPTTEGCIGGGDKRRSKDSSGVGDGTRKKVCTGAGEERPPRGSGKLWLDVAAESVAGKGAGTFPLILKHGVGLHPSAHFQEANGTVEATLEIYNTEALPSASPPIRTSSFQRQSPLLSPSPSPFVSLSTRNTLETPPYSPDNW